MWWKLHSCPHAITDVEREVSHESTSCRRRGLGFPAVHRDIEFCKREVVQ